MKKKSTEKFDSSISLSFYLYVSRHSPFIQRFYTDKKENKFSHHKQRPTMRLILIWLSLSSLFFTAIAFIQPTCPGNRPIQLISNRAATLAIMAKKDFNQHCVDSSVSLSHSNSDVLRFSAANMLKSKILPTIFGTLFSFLVSFPSTSMYKSTSVSSMGQQASTARVVQLVNAAEKAFGNLEGTQAPLFSLPGSTGNSVSLTDLTQTGKYTVLYFYPGDFTSGCTLEANAFQKNLDAIKALNAQVVGVSVDPVDKHVEFRKSCGLDFVLLSDEGGKVSEAYGTALDIPFLGKFSNRQTYLISPNGIVEKVFTNLNGKVSKHPEEVIAALEELKK